MVKKILGVSLLLLLLTGCGGVQSRSLVWQQLTYSLTGGIAGFDRQVVIQANGLYLIVDGGQPEVRGELSAGSLRRLREQAALIDWSALEAAYTDPRVADAFMERVSWVTAEGEILVTVGTGSTPPTDLADLLLLLRELSRHPQSSISDKNAVIASPLRRGFFLQIGST